MKKVIKFRAWDGHTMAHFRVGAENPFPSEKNLDWITDQTLMQFTGLLDKNGKEIYEGDIVDCTHWYFDGAEQESNFRAEIAFEAGSFGLTNIKNGYYHDNVGNRTDEDKRKDFCYIGNLVWNSDDYEVIGNIYENKDLL